MRQHFILFVAIWLVACAATAGVRKEPSPAAGPMEIGDSTALFVGVREFVEDETLTKVEYAVDDAVDLAHLLVFERPLLHGSRVILALSGEPQKEESRRRLAALKAANAAVREARQENILKLLEQQAKKVGENGMLIASFSTHGVNDRGEQRLLAASSLLDHLETSVSEVKLREIVSRRNVPRALILIDACREQLTRDVRAGTASPRSAGAKLMEELGKIRGTVVLSAAAPGQYAYDYEGNGVFTAAVIDGLRCAAQRDANGFVTVQALRDYVEDRVLSWIRKHKDPETRIATQLSDAGRAARMPLASCEAVNGKQRAARRN